MVARLQTFYDAANPLLIAATMTTRRHFLNASLLSAVALAAPYAQAQTPTYPSKPIRIVVPFGPGGATDVVARTVADKLSARLGQPVIVDNKPGASTMIGAEAVAKAAPDGYTLMVSGSSTYSVAPALKERMPYDHQKDLALIALLVKAPLVLVSGPSAPVKSLSELIALAKSKPGDLGYATFGAGSAPHLVGEMFAHEAGIKVMAVPYKGSAPASMALLGGEIQFAFDTITSVGPHIKSGKLRPLAVSSVQRASALPDVPTLGELKLGKASFDGFYGLAAPAGTPAAIQQLLGRELAAIMALPDVKEKMLAAGLEPGFLDAPAFNAKVADEIATFKAAGKRAHIVME